MQVRGETLEPAHGLRISIRPNRHVMRVVSHVDPRGVGVEHLETWVLGSQLAGQLFPSLSVHQWVPCWCHVGPPLGGSDQARPGCDG